LVKELCRILKYPKIEKLTRKINSFSANTFIAFHIKSTILVKPKLVIDISPDPKDNYLLSIADTIAADYLITGDKPHLLALKRFGETEIVTFSEFCKKLSIG
jgi:uncharacterized protein